MLGGWNVVTCQAVGSIDMNPGTFSRYIYGLLVRAQAHVLRPLYLAVAGLRKRLPRDLDIHGEHLVLFKLLLRLVMPLALCSTLIVSRIELCVVQLTLAAPR